MEWGKAKGAATKHRLAIDRLGVPLIQILFPQLGIFAIAEQFLKQLKL